MSQKKELYIENSPPRHPWFVISVLLPYLIFWIIDCALWGISILLIYKNEFPLFLPLIIGVALFSTTFQLKLTKALIWLSFGKETIRIVDEQLIIKRKRAIGFKNLKLDLKHISNLRLAPIPSAKKLNREYFNIFLAKGLYAPKLGGSVLFDYKETTIPIGNLVPENESINLIQSL